MILIKGLKLWRFDNTISEFLTYFHCACAETAILDILVKNLTSPFASATTISYETHVFHYRVMFNYGIYSMFLCYVAWSCDLDLWSFDLVSVLYTLLRMLDPHTNLIWPILRLSVTKLWITEFDHISVRLSTTVTAHAPCHVTYHRGNGSHFLIHDPILCIHFVTFWALRRRLSHVIGENSVYSIVKATISLRMRKITWSVHKGSPKTTGSNFLTPNSLFTTIYLILYNTIL